MPHFFLEPCDLSHIQVYLTLFGIKLFFKLPNPSVIHLCRFLKISDCRLQLIWGILCPFDFEYCQTYQYPIKEYDFHEIVDTLVESGFIGERFDVEVQFFACSAWATSINDFAIEIDFETVGSLTAAADEPVHHGETVGENPLQDVIQRSTDDFEADQQEFHDWQHFSF